MDLVFVPIILLGVLIVIAGLLILADRLLGGGGERTVTVNEKKELVVRGDDTLLNTLSDNKIFIPSACGGKATCGFCKVRLLEGGGDIKPTEEPFLSKEERARNVRLSCQIKVRENMRIEIPEGLLEASEYRAKVTAIEELTYDTRLVRFQLIEPTEMDFKPGQYAQVKVPGLDVIRAYSIASNPANKNEVEFIVRLVPKGLATTFVHKALLVGDEIILTGPYGDFYVREETEREMICIAGGSGKAPIRSILYYLRDKKSKRKITYFFGAKTTRDLYYTDEMRQLEKEFENFTYVPALSEPDEDDAWDGETGLITEVVDRLTGDLSNAEGYLCGSPGMINACIDVLKAHDMPDENVFFDKFDL